MALIFLYVSVLIQTQEDPQVVSLKTADLGDNITLHCEVLSERGGTLYWWLLALYMNQEQYTHPMNLGSHWEKELTLCSTAAWSLTLCFQRRARKYITIVRKEVMSKVVSVLFSHKVCTYVQGIVLGGS